MLIQLPDWTIELEEKLDRVIKDMAVKNHIDIIKINDSQTIKNAKEDISHILVDLYWNYKVDERKRLEEFEEGKKKSKRRKTTSRKINRK